MAAVATGGPRMHVIDPEYRELYGGLAAELARRRMQNPLTYVSQ